MIWLKICGYPIKKKRDTRTAEREVYAQIAALDMVNFSEKQLIIKAIHSVHDKTPDEDGHLLKVEAPYAFSRWRKIKEKLGLKHTQSILEYHQNNDQALKEFSKKYVAKREKNIQNAVRYAKCRWNLKIEYENFVTLFHEEYEKEWFRRNNPFMQGAMLIASPFLGALLSYSIKKIKDEIDVRCEQKDTQRVERQQRMQLALENEIEFHKKLEDSSREYRQQWGWLHYFSGTESLENDEKSHRKKIEEYTRELEHLRSLQ